MLSVVCCLPTLLCEVVTGTALIFYLAGRQDRQYVPPLNIIYTMPSLSSAFIASTPSNVPVTLALPYLNPLYIKASDISNSKRT